MKLLSRLRLKRGIALLAGAAAATVAVLGLTAAPASASSSFSAWVDPASNKFVFLDAQGGGIYNGTPIITWYCNGGSNQSYGATAT
ncbi:hypothetical protein ACFFX1_05890 [Dactylosporangium sucinum]|uniref:Uncharacterized protein n=1 Tax=Dactylosporangium sucinum TaxID=1424081 RepID=A0A917X7L1_9ACTN|nr:hypothetical protein [Dactylosporangium sucinum]GGM87241.1 hypothetical protein GCM10007977_106480 [Dactylosporangium sucinum]